MPLEDGQCCWSDYGLEHELPETPHTWDSSEASPDNSALGEVGVGEIPRSHYSESPSRHLQVDRGRSQAK